MLKAKIVIMLNERTNFKYQTSNLHISNINIELKPIPYFWHQIKFHMDTTTISLVISIIAFIISISIFFILNKKQKMQRPKAMTAILQDHSSYRLMKDW